MARRARPTVNTLVSYIAPDDDAITADEAAYEEYLSTADTRHLKLSGDAGRYWLRPLDSRQWQRLGDVIKAASDESLRDDLDTVVSMTQTYTDIALESLVGCDGHPVVTRVNEDGSFEQEIVVWKVGTPRPRDLDSELRQDNVLIGGIIDFLIRVSTLTESEKNR